MMPPSARGSRRSAGRTSRKRLTVAGTLRQTLRYGENPHQAAAFYASGTRPGVASAVQVQGKELSYNNLNDTDAAFECVAEFERADRGDHQACDAVRGGLGRVAGGGVGCGVPLRSGVAVWRDRRGEPDAGRGGGGEVCRDLHRGDHRAGCRRGGAGGAGAEEESAAAADRRDARSGGGRADVPQPVGRVPGADAGMPDGLRRRTSRW